MTNSSPTASILGDKTISSILPKRGKIEAPAGEDGPGVVPVSFDIKINCETKEGTLSCYEDKVDNFKLASMYAIDAKQAAKDLAEIKEDFLKKYIALLGDDFQNIEISFSNIVLGEYKLYDKMFERFPSDASPAEVVVLNLADDAGKNFFKKVCPNQYEPRVAA